MRWIVGAYAICDRSLHLDRQRHRLWATGVVPEVRRTPLPKFDIPTNCFPPACRQFTYLADSQDNFAWARVRRAELRHDRPARRLGRAALRRGRAREHDRDAGELPADADVVPGPGAQAHLGRAAAEGDACATSPPTTRRCTSATAAASAAAASTRPASAPRTSPASSDLFDKETADTYEAGFKGEFMDRRLSTNLSLYYTQANGSYFFVFDPNTSTQNLGNLGDVDYKGLELELQARVDRELRCVSRHRLHRQRDQGIRPRRDRRRQPGAAGFRVQRQPRPAVSSASWRHSAVRAAFIRADLDVTGPTWFYPDNFTERDTIERAEPARRARERVLVGHRVGEESQRRGIQRRVVARVRCSSRTRATPTISCSRHCRDAGASTSPYRF